MDLKTQVQALEAMANNLTRATSVREKVRLADRIFEALGECEQLVENFIVTGLAGTNGSKKSNQSEEPKTGMASDTRTATGTTSKQFKNMTLADVGRDLLKERGVLHGKEIETLAKSGGFKSNASNFQSYLAVAFKRDGGIVNIGKNRWKLKEAAIQTNQAA